MTIVLVTTAWFGGTLAAGAEDAGVDEVHYTFTGATSVTFDWRGPANDLRYHRRIRAEPRVQSRLRGGDGGVGTARPEDDADISPRRALGSRRSGGPEPRGGGHHVRHAGRAGVGATDRRRNVHGEPVGPLGRPRGALETAVPRAPERLRGGNEGAQRQAHGRVAEGHRSLHAGLPAGASSLDFRAYLTQASPGSCFTADDAEIRAG
jgi:hypothetical protein